MRLLHVTSLAAIAAMFSFNVACSGGDDKPAPDADADTDTDADADSDADADADTADLVISLFYVGGADVTGDPLTYNNGLETIVSDIYSYDGANLSPAIRAVCRWTWDIVPTTDPILDAALSSCTDDVGAPCAFAFTVVGENGAENGTTDCDLVLNTANAGSTPTYAYGYHSDWNPGGGDPAYGETWALYDSGDAAATPPREPSWFAYGYAYFDVAETPNFEYFQGNFYYYEQN